MEEREQEAETEIPTAACTTVLQQFLVRTCAYIHEGSVHNQRSIYMQSRNHYYYWLADMICTTTNRISSYKKPNYHYFQVVFPHGEFRIRRLRFGRLFQAYSVFVRKRLFSAVITMRSGSEVKICTNR